jgi:hypothetical protein
MIKARDLMDKSGLSHRTTPPAPNPRRGARYSLTINPIIP